MKDEEVGNRGSKHRGNKGSRSVGSVGFVFFAETWLLIAPGRFFGFVWKNRVQSSVVSPQCSGTRLEWLLDRYGTGMGLFRNLVSRVKRDLGPGGHGSSLTASARSLRGWEEARTLI